MAIVFAVRGTSTTAFFSGGFPTPTTYGSANVSASVAAGVIGGSTLDLDQGAFGQHSLSYNGYQNISLTQQWSILIRCAVGSTSDANQFFAIGAYGQLGTLQWRNGGVGLLPLTSTDYAGSTLVTLNITQAATIGAYYDYFCTFDGSLAAANQITYLNSTATGTASTGATRTAYSTGFGTGIILGAQNAAGQNSTRLFVNEFVIWNTIVNPTSVVLTNTTAALNGTARTAFVQVTASTGGNVTVAGVNRKLTSLGPPRMF